MDRISNLEILKRVAFELFDRSSRVRRYFDDAGPGDLGENQQFIDTIRIALAEQEAKVIDTLNREKSIQPEVIEQSKLLEKSLFENLNVFSRWFAQLHEFLVYLPRLSVTTEAYYALEGSFGKAFDMQKPSIILGSVFNAVEYDFIEIVKERLPDLGNIAGRKTKNVVIELAICDHASPAAWAILAHEFGHAIDHDMGISEKIANEIVTDPQTSIFDPVHSWCSELTADLIAAEALGPAPILAISSLEYCFFPQIELYYTEGRYYKTHPTTRWRMKVVADYLKKKYGENSFLDEDLDFMEAAWNYSLEYHETDVHKRELIRNLDEATYNVLISEYGRSISNMVYDLHLPKHEVKKEKLDRCLHRLKNGYPIGSQGKIRVELQQEIENYQSKIEKAKVERTFNPISQRDAFYELLEKFPEEPLSPAYILLAAHKTRKDIFDNCFNPKEQRAEYSKQYIHGICDELHKIDELSASSIKGSSVHRIILERQNFGLDELY
jgi:hypothetical protein